MALNLQGFVTPEQSWGGLSDISRNLRIDEQRKEQDRMRQEAEKAASTKYLTDILDEKEFLTGDMHDPYRNINIQQLKQEGLELIKQGVDNTQLAMALSPKINKLSQETQILKALQRQRKEAVDKLKGNPAIDIDAFDKAFKNIYFETDESGNRSLKDISSLDPTKNYVDEILSTQRVYTPAGIDEYLKKAQLNVVGESAIVTDARGGSRSAKLKVSKPNFMQLNIDPATGKLSEDEKFIPKYQVATDGGEPIMAKFKTKRGKDVEAPLRMLDEATFDNLMLDTNARAYIMQEANAVAKELGVPVTDTKVKTFARAIAYDLFKNSTQHRSTFEEAEAKKEAPAPRTTTNIYTGGGGQGQTYDDAYGELEATVRNYNPGELVPLSEAPQMLFDDLLKKGRAGSIMPTALSSNNVFVKMDGNELVLVIKDIDNKEKRVLKLGRVATNRQANPKDKGTQQAIIKQGEGSGTPAPQNTNKKPTLAEQMRANAAKNKPK